MTSVALGGGGLTERERIELALGLWKKKEE